MASKSIHQPYNDNALKHFGFENDPIYGVFSSNSVHEVLLTDDDTSFIKIKNLLETETIQGKNIKNYKRGFVLPGCPVTLDRIKSAAKEQNKGKFIGSTKRAGENTIIRKRGGGRMALRRRRQDKRNAPEVFKPIFEIFAI